MKKVLILGLGMSGTAALKRCYEKGYRSFFVIDKKLPDLLLLTKEYGDCDIEGDSDSFEALWKSDEIEFAVQAPGVGPKSPTWIRLKQSGVPIIGEMQLGLEDLEGHKIGITGSNGKSTTVTLLAHIMKSAGFKAEAVGNIGVAVSSLPRRGADRWWIVEASSYQLESLSGPIFDIGVLLNIAENHLDRYGEMEKYVEAKACIQKALKPKAPFLIKRDILDRWPSMWPCQNLEVWDEMTLSPEFQNFISKKEFAGKQASGYKDELSHDAENILVALAICQKLGISLEMVRKGLQTYSKLPHRMEWVGNLGLVQFINDSKSTSVASTLHALEAISAPLVLIAGGVHKGASYTDWAGPLKAKAVGVCLFGQAKDLIAQDLHFEGVKCTIYDNLEKAVEQAHKQLEEKGGNVLFSPGCSSFDMFKNFEERGERFRESIHELKAGGLHDKTRHDHQCSTN